MQLPKQCTLTAEDLIVVIRDPGTVLAFDTRRKTLMLTSRESLTVPEFGLVLVVEPETIGATSDLEGLSDSEMERELEATVDELNTQLHDPAQRRTLFPELADALGD